MIDSTTVTRNFITKLQFLKYCPANVPRSLNSPINIIVAHDLFINYLPSLLQFNTNEYEKIRAKFNSQTENERNIWILECKKFLLTKISDINEMISMGIHSNLLSQWQSDIKLLKSAYDNKYESITS